MKQSPNDLKDYHAIALENGLRVLLIHNQESKKSAAALAVNVGHFSDPKERQGMAHFLEHMLFLGTEKYPDGSEYQKFISQYGGSNNAWTATEHTCYFFDIHQNYFEEALDRFGQFFSAPLLSAEFVHKERQNIDAEFKLKLKDDIRRIYDVHKETINQAHPFSQFSVGNIDTLADHPNTSMQSEIKAFFEKYYRADYMTLAIEGPQSLEQLSLLAQQKFSTIKPATKALEPISDPLYLPEHQQKLIQIQPVKNDKQVIISFAMPCIDKYYRHKPESLLAYLLGHEGPGSILSFLKNKQWAMGLSAGSGINGSNFKDFNISIPLTENGEQHIDEIIEIVFSYIALLKQTSLPDHYYQEKKSIAELSFLYQEKMQALESVSQLVLNMQHYPIEDYIFGDYAMEGMCNDSISELLNYLLPTNMRIVHISPKNDFDKTSFWYQVPYKVTDISKDQLLKWQNLPVYKELFLPAKNPYIVPDPKVLVSDDLTIKPTQPKLLEQSSGYSLWFKQDSTFKVPKGYIYINIDSPYAIESTANIGMTRLFIDLFTNAIIEEHYDAELAGIHYHLYPHQGGMTLQLSGLSEKQNILLSHLLPSFKNHSFDEQSFELFKSQLIRNWQNADKSKSISQLFSTLSSVMQPKNPSSEKLAIALDEITFSNFNDFCQQLFADISIEALIHGNWCEEDALNINLQIKKTFAIQDNSDNKIKIPVLDIKDQGELLIPLILPEHDHATVLYYPQQKKDVSSIAKTIVTSQLLSPLFFQEMRTEKQYGYLVGVGFVPINRFPGIAFYIQSPHTDSTKLVDAMDEFLSNCQRLVKEMSEDDWQHLQQGLASQLQEKDASLRIKSQRFWVAICNKDTTFSHKTELINAILALTLSDISLYIKECLVKTATTDRITLISFPNEEFRIKNNLSGENIDEITQFCQRKY
ncbi:MAG: insulinase family protein [Alteromonadaceae bacterium]|nr:insulinase family protein [Alteromonadaceae bacterium]